MPLESAATIPWQDMMYTVKNCDFTEGSCVGAGGGSEELDFIDVGLECIVVVLVSKTDRKRDVFGESPKRVVLVLSLSGVVGPWSFAAGTTDANGFHFGNNAFNDRFGVLCEWRLGSGVVVVFFGV